MVKPFSIQAPEQVAKEYGGNKQKIAEAAQLGIVDPTAAVLAGMFIDKMRTAQQMEGGQKPTIAQQVLGAPQPQPQPQAMPPQGAPPQMGGGLGATPQAMPPEMGMDEGGIVGLDLPDTMFDEPNNGSYAPGGLVAFADGGGALGPWFESQATEAIPGIGITSRQRSAAKNAAVDGVPNSYHRTDNARDFTPPKGMSMSSLASRLKALYGAGFDVLDEGNHVHVEPGPKSARMVHTTPRKADIGTAQGRAISFEDSALLGSGMLAGLPREGLDRARAAASEVLDPKVQEKERKADMWAGLAEMGFRMAATTSPFMLQAIGEAATATLPGIQASKKERKQAKNEAVRTLMAIEDVDRKTAIAGVELGMDIYKSGLSQEQFEQRMSMDDRQLRQQATLAREGNASAERIAAMRPESLDFRESLVRDVYRDYKRRNATGELIVNGRRLPPNSVSDEELRDMAGREVLNRLPTSQQGGAGWPGNPGAQTGAPQPQVVSTDYGPM